MPATENVSIVFMWWMFVTMIVWIPCSAALSTNLTVSGRHLLIDNPIAGPLPSSAIAFDFNGFELNLTVQTHSSWEVLQRVDILLSTVCYPINGSAMSTTGRKGQRFGIFVEGVGQLVDWTIDTNYSRCGEALLFPVWNSSVSSIAERTGISVQKETEANFNGIDADIPNFVMFHGFQITTTEGSVSIHSPPGAFFEASAPATLSSTSAARRMEFIGDSITAGYCNLCKQFPNASVAPPSYDLENFLLTWAHLTCLSLGAECHTEAWSGRGIIRNCDETAPVLMPDIVQRAIATVPSNTTLFGNVSNVWDASRFVPDVVVINLGTNDFACNPILNGSLFNHSYEVAYVEMVQRFALSYANATTYFLACGPMTDMYCEPVFTVIAELKQRGIRAHFLDQRNLLPPSNQCCGHPDTVADSVIAEATVARIRDVMGW